MWKILLQLVLFALPWSLRRRALGLFFGYQIDRTARVGFSIVNVDRCVLMADSYIGHFTAIKGLTRLEIGERGRLGKFNWVTGISKGNSSHFTTEPERDPSLIIGQDAAITSRHLIDCTNRVSVGAFSTFAGFRSQILTHAIDFGTSRQSSAPVTIGEYCFVGTGCIILKGSILPDRSILAAGAILAKAMSEPDMLYSGQPAAAVRGVDTSKGYFVRGRGFVN